MDLKSRIRDVADFPQKGVVFKDITPLLKDPSAFQQAIAILKERYENRGIQKICAIESRGFIFGAPLAFAMGLPLVPVRKLGKLPWTRHTQEYELEYGKDSIEIHTDALEKGEKILIVDDVLATGGTAKALCLLLERLHVRIEGLAFLIELDFLKGREKLKSYESFAIIHY